MKKKFCLEAGMIASSGDQECQLSRTRAYDIRRCREVLHCSLALISVLVIYRDVRIDEIRVCGRAFGQNTYFG